MRFSFTDERQATKCSGSALYKQVGLLQVMNDSTGVPDRVLRSVWVRGVVSTLRSVDTQVWKLHLVDGDRLVLGVSRRGGHHSGRAGRRPAGDRWKKTCETVIEPRCRRLLHDQF